MPTTTRRSRLNPQFAVAYNNRGNAYDDKGDVDRAIADYNAALQIDANYAAAYYNRGIAWRRKGDLDRAIADYDQAIKLNPTATAYNNRGSAWDAKGEIDRAMADLDQRSSSIRSCRTPTSTAATPSASGSISPPRSPTTRWRSRSRRTRRWLTTIAPGRIISPATANDALTDINRAIDA